MIVESSKIVRTGRARAPSIEGLAVSIVSSPVPNSFFTAAAGDERRRCRMLPRLALLHDFSMQREVETFALDVLRHPEANENLDHEENDQADDGIINEDGD